jgi:hypothetical protein
MRPSAGDRVDPPEMIDGLRLAAKARSVDGERLDVERPHSAGIVQ